MKKIILFSICAIVFLTLSCKKKKGSTFTSMQIEENIAASKILMIVSNADSYGDSDIEASNHFAEIVLAYDEFEKAGYFIDFVSPKGGKAPVGYLDTTNTTQKRYLYDSKFMDRLNNTRSPKEIKTTSYKAVYYSGGGAAMFGVPENKAIQDITMEIYEENQGIVSAICHGSAGLVNLKTKDGKYLYEGKHVNGYPDMFEDINGAYYQYFPFSIEGKLKERGGIFQYSLEGWDDFSIVDGRLITGQDPTATRGVAKKVIEALEQL